MKRFIYLAILATALTACGGRKQAEQGNGIDLIIGAVDTIKTVAEQPEDDIKPEELPGDTLCEFEGKTVMFRYLDDTADVESVPVSEVTIFSGGRPFSVCKVNGYCNSVSADGKVLKIAVGADTMRYALSSLPKSVNPVKDLAGKGVSEHRMRHTFKAGDSPRINVFLLSAYMPETYPVYVNRMIAAIMQSDIRQIFNDYDTRPDLMKEYLKLQKKPNAYQGLNVSSSTPEEIGKYFARKFEKSYRQYFADALKEEDWGPQEEYLLETAPVWNSEDDRLTTYRFYKYHYGGGAHGMMNEFYITFDNSDGRILGYRDILGDDGMGRTAIKLAKGLDSLLDSEGHTSDLGKEQEEEYSDMLMNEVYQEYLYPRPAITRNGVIFTYQPYDKGSFADGILHVLIGE